MPKQTVRCAMKREHLIKQAYKSFSIFRKPDRCVLHDNSCLECRDHEKILKKTTRETLSPEIIGPVGYSPLPNMNPAAMAYFLQKLIELAVMKSNDWDGDPFLVRFINLVLEGPNNEQFSLLNKEQKKLILQTLDYLKSEYAEIIEYECWDEDLDEAIGNWRDDDSF